MNAPETADLIGRALHDRHMRQPSIRLLLDAIPQMSIEDLIEGVERLNQGGANVILSDADVWVRMLNRKPGWYWVRARDNGCVGNNAGKGEWTPLEWRWWTPTRGTWENPAGRIRARYNPRAGGDSMGYHGLTEFEIEIIETPIPAPPA